MKYFATLALLLLVFVLPIAAQLPELPNAFIAAGGGYSDTSKGFAFAAYAHKTGIDAGTGKGVYSYSEARTYRFGRGKTILQATELTEGVLYVFFDKALVTTPTFSGFRVTMAVDGNAGLSTTSTGSVGYTMGAKVVARVAPLKSKWGLIFSADPNRSSVAGVHASQAAVGVSYGFGGF